MPRFSRTKPPFPPTLDHLAYREHVRADFDETCAHCCLPEKYAQGRSGFQVDHFRPKWMFTSRLAANHFHNLYWTCYACNKQKHDKWPSANAQAAGARFVDLCIDEFEHHFRITKDFELVPISPAGRYTIQMLLLNREKLPEIRRELYYQGRGCAPWIFPGAGFARWLRANVRRLLPKSSWKP
jgi:hypothetical protein